MGRGDNVRYSLVVRLLPLALAVSACTRAEETIEHRCARLREHVLDLRMEGLPAADRAAHRKALGQALGDRFADECEALTSKQIDCALTATDIVASTECSAAR